MRSPVPPGSCGDLLVAAKLSSALVPAQLLSGPCTCPLIILSLGSAALGRVSMLLYSLQPASDLLMLSLAQAANSRGCAPS